jgi:hypothetical protein
MKSSEVLSGRAGTDASSAITPAKQYGGVSSKIKKVSYSTEKAS